MRILCLDFETKDPLLMKYGSGWCFKHNFPETEFTILGAGVVTHDNKEEYIDFIENSNAKADLKEYIDNHDAVLCHNAQYDIGCLYFIYSGDSVYRDKTILDTMIMAKQDTQQLLSYSLDNLCKHYGCDQKKESDILHDYAWLSGIYQKHIKETTGVNKRKRPTDNVLDKFCKENLDMFPSEIVGKYCVQDCKGTIALCNKIMPKLDLKLIQEDSDALKMCIDVKVRGIRIDLNKAHELVKRFGDIAKDAADEFCNDLGNPADFNINSNKQLAEALREHGYDLPTTEHGNASLRSGWLEEQEDAIFHQLKRYRKALKVQKDFLHKLINYQSVIPEKYKQNGKGWLFPTLKLYGATLTGRFSSGGGQGCLELSIHQIPARDEEFGAPIREVFLPHDNEQMICGDFSSQEPRLQVHYASILGCSGAPEVAKEYNNNKQLDIYTYIATTAQIDRKDAKTIHLGLSYGMYINKLAITLGVTLERAQQLLDQYYSKFIFMRQLQKITSKNLLKLGYIKTIGGRKLKIDDPYEFRGKIKTQESKALSKLIQGSAGDQTRLAMINAWKQGLKLIFSVHDEIGVSSDNPDRDRKVLEDCMCNTVKLCLPMHVDAGVGRNWGEAK